MPSRQRAATLRLAHTAAMLAEARRLWSTPDILPWSAWLERTVDAGRARGLALPRRLRAAEEWLLWREAVATACSQFGVLLADDLVDAVRNAVGIADDWGCVPAATSVETAALRAAREGFERRCRDINALGTTLWMRCLELAPPEAPARLLGFDALGPVRLRRLAALGVTPWSLPATAARAGTVSVRGEADERSEIAAAAQWSRDRLLKDPTARLLIVAPRLGLRHEIVRAFAQALAPDALLNASPSAPMFAIEGGLPLGGYPLVKAALGALRLSCEALQCPQYSELLCSAFIGVGTAAQRQQLDVWLRAANVDELDLALLRELSQRAAGREPAGLLLGPLAQALTPEAPAAALQSASFWARRFVALLAACGWPGDAPLSSEEQQLRQRFEQLLGDFASIDAEAALMTQLQAQRLLQRLAQSTAYEPASDDVPVTITSDCADPIVRYDGIWVAGLSADVWPSPASPDALLPLSLQRAAGLPQASAAGQLALARRTQQRWSGAANTLVMSWPASSDGVARDASPLLAELSSLAPAPEIPPAPWNLPQWLRAQGRFESYRDQTGRAWSGGPRLPGGTRLLELQALCPFRAYAELRLAARPLAEPAPGIDPRVRGKLLHKALELFWRATPDSEALQGLSAQAQLERVGEALRGACAQVLHECLVQPPPQLVALELVRAARLIGELLDWERTRAPFAVQALEQRQGLSLDDWTLTLRLDRIDALADGRLAVIDYKSGALEAFEPETLRPRRPQLLAYAEGGGARVAAVAMVYLGADGVRLRGIADEDERLRGLAAPKPGGPSWTQLRARWALQLRALTQEFVAGHAAVAPLDGARSCQYCHLHMSCRIDAQGLAAAPVSRAPLADHGH